MERWSIHNSTTFWVDTRINVKKLSIDFLIYYFILFCIEIIRNQTYKIEEKSPAPFVSWVDEFTLGWVAFVRLASWLGQQVHRLHPKASSKGVESWDGWWECMVFISDLYMVNHKYFSNFSNQFLNLSQISKLF